MTEQDQPQNPFAPPPPPAPSGPTWPPAGPAPYAAPPQPGGYPPPGWSPHPYGTPYPTGPRPTSSWAIAALVTGVFALVPVAITCGIVALVQIRKRHERGTGLAISGIVLGGVWAVAGIVALVVLASTALGGFEGTVRQAGSTTPGTCLDRADDSTGVARVVPCSEPHDGEVYAVVQLPESPWPGEGDLDDAAMDGCQDRYEPYLGRGYYSSDFDYGWFAPDAAEWAAGERRVVCVVLPMWPDDLPGRSVKGSGR